MKILIVEDNGDLRDIYTSLFTTTGHQIASAENGLDGVVKAVDFKPDIVLLDLISDNTSVSPFVIIVSNLSQQADIDMAKARGAHEYIRKSDFAGESLVAEVERLYQARVGKAK